MNKNTDTEFLLISLREDVDKLTLPYKHQVMQELEPDGPTVQVVQREILLKPLLVQLEEAIGSSHSVVARGGADPSTRAVIDASALMLLTEIEDELRELWSTVFAPRVKARPVSITRAVRQFFIQVNKLVMDKRLENEELWKIRRLINLWAIQIEAKFDPPIVIEVTRPCPKCHQSFVYDEFNDRVLALSVQWRKSFEGSSGECRACGHVWYGQAELRQLRWELDQLDEELDLSSADTPDQED